MRVRDLRNVYTVVSVLAVLAIGGTVSWASREMSQAAVTDRTAERIAETAAALRYLVIDTILFFEKRTEQQWWPKYIELGNMLANLRLGWRQDDHIEQLQHEHKQIGILYKRMLEYHRTALMSDGQQARFGRLRARAASRLLGLSQQMLSNAFQLSAISDARVAAAQQRLGLLVTLLVIIMAAIVVGHWVLLSRRVLAPIERLQRGTRAVAAGDFSGRIPVDREDELGWLAGAFNEMTRRIQESTAALKRLNEELEARVKERTAALDIALTELRRSEEHYRMLFEANPHPMWVYDAFTLEFLAVNEAAVEQYGYTREEFLHLQIAALRLPEERSLVPAAVRRLDPSRRHQGTYRLCRKSGDVIDVEVISEGIAFEGRQARLVLALDITERKLAQEEVQRLNAELEQRVRQRTAELEAVNRELEAFTYSVSHDLRAPLRHIGGFADLLQTEASAALHDPARHYLANIIDSVAHMGKLIDDLLAFSKMGRAEIRRSWIDMEQLVREVVDELASAEGDRRIEWIIQALPNVRGDRAMIKQVWVNLVGNALKYTRGREVAKIEIGYSEPNGEPEFYVADNGAGFDMAYADKLFGVFQRLHHADEFEGTGVGLANVQRIVMRHGGRTRARGAVNQGAVFYFSLPVSEVANETEADSAYRRQREGR